MAVAPHSARPHPAGQAPNPTVAYYRRLPESALADLRLSRSALAVLGQLDGFAREKVECWPSVATLAEALGLCRRTVQLALARLKATGYVAERPAENPTGRTLVLLWRTGGANPTAPRAQAPYTQGLPGGRKPARPTQRQSGEGKERASRFAFKAPEPEPVPIVPRRVEPRPSEAEKTAALRDWLGVIPSGTPLARSLAARLAERLKV